MFKSAEIYRLTRPVSTEALEAALAAHAFAPLASNELMRMGWSAPRGAGLVHVVHGHMLVELTTEKKLIPSKVVNQMAKERAAELEEQQGFAPGKKAMKELKERIHDELLPTALKTRSATRAWIDPKGWLVVDGTPSKADDIIKLLLKAVDRFPVESLRVNRSPVAMMTAWLNDDEAPAGFTIDQDATLRATGESKAQVKYVRHTLEPDAMRRHIAAGKQCVKLAMTWDRKISFVLTEALAVKSIKLLDVMTENHVAKDQSERFDGDFLLFSGEFSKLLGDLVPALGGEFEEVKAA